MGKKCLPGVICFENVTIVFIIIIIILIVFYVYKTSHHRIKYIKNNDTYTDYSQLQQQYNNNNNINTRGFVFNNSYMTQPRMNDTLLDPYNPPLVDNSYFGFGSGGGMVMPINIQTQAQRPPPMVMMAASAADNYQQVGLLTRANGSEMILPLMGQSLYTNRDKWNYYSMSDKNNIVKLPITFKGRNGMAEYGVDSLNSGDHVRVEGYNDKFKVTMYDNKLLRYIPF
jgi:hypothetical protein